MVLLPPDGGIAPVPPDPLAMLRDAAIEHIEMIPWGSNYTFAASLRTSDGETCFGIYKPKRGEVPLRDFPNGTLYRREVAAYEFATLIGWDIVPPTIVREDAPHGIGSLQLYVQPRTDPAARFERLRETRRADLQRMALFDLLVNNADRKGGHCLLDIEGHLWGIDHGLTFHQVPKLRTVIWDFCGEPFPDDLLDCLVELRRNAALAGTIRSTLAPLISSAEIDALFQRWDRLIESGEYPVLDPYRNVPWPPF